MCEKRVGKWVVESIFEFMLLYSVIITWVFGTVLAPGWLKIIAFTFPPYAWYLVAEKVSQINGWI